MANKNYSIWHEPGLLLTSTPTGVPTNVPFVTYTQVPNCGYTITYTSKIEKVGPTTPIDFSFANTTLSPTTHPYVVQDDANKQYVLLS